MSDTVSQIKERLNIVDVIAGYIKLQKSGINFKARCPFHNEKTASFYVSTERQIWHCFGCQKGGDILSFVQDIEGVEFKEALRTLAQRAGVKLENYDPSVRDEKAILYEICETSARFFEKQLHHSSAGKNALKYLKDRGLTDNTIKEFRLGFVPEGWHNLSQFLRNCGYNDKDIKNSGLALSREDGSDLYDRFRSRIIFPIADLNDQIVGFTGRIFENSSGPAEFPGHKAPDPGAKYINTPQTAIYDKSRVLYGLNKAKAETRRLDRCLLVEGNIDAIMSYQAGVKNVAATSGTALTPSHLQLLQRFTNNLDFCFDTDQAGLVATRRGLGLALSQNLNIKIVHLPDPQCKDPADYVKKFPGKWSEIVQLSKPVIEFYFDKLRSELDLSSVEGKKAIVLSLGPLIKRLSSSVEKSHWISKLSAVLKTKENAVESDIFNLKDDLDVYQSSSPDLGSEKGAVKNQASNPLTSNIFSEALLAVIIRNPNLFSKELGDIKVELLDIETADIIKEFKGAKVDKFKFDEFAKKFDGAKKMKLEFAYLKAQELLKEFSVEELRAEFLGIKKALERKYISVRLSELEMDIKQAEELNDKPRLAGLLGKFNNLTKEINKSS